MFTYLCMLTCERNHNLSARSAVAGVYPNANGIGIILFLLSILLTLMFSRPVSGQTENDLSMPAEYIRDLTLPGSNNHFLRPARIAVDRSQNEIYVADAGNARVLIFDERGTARFEFSTAARCGSPIDLAVSPQGHIYVLGTQSGGRSVFAFDYDGRFLRTITLPDSNADVAGIAVDDADVVYALDQTHLEAVCLRDDGTVVRRFPILGDIGPTDRTDLVLGAPTIIGEVLYLPVSSLRTVYRYGLDGDFIGSTGHGGTGVGELNFPASVAATEDGMILVLDKHRFTVLCYSPAGTFLGEFGGRGTSPGWFYHPAWLAVDGADQVYIGQIFRNKIQVCRLPASIRRRLADENRRAADTQAAAVKE